MATKANFVLIVEPELGKMDAVYLTLMRQGYQFGFARSKEEAIGVLSVDLYNFVVTDYEQLSVATLEFQRRLVENKSKARIIFTYPKGLNIAEKDGSCFWLGEPFETNELLSILGQG